MSTANLPVGNPADGAFRLFLRGTDFAVVTAIPNVLQAVALIRTGEQARAGAQVPYRVWPQKLP